MRTARRNRPNGDGFTREITVKMKVIEVLEGRAESLRVKEVVQILNLSKSKVYGLIARGDLPSSRIDGAIRLDPNHVIEWWKQHQTGLAARPSAPVGSMVHKAAASATNQLERAG